MFTNDLMPVETDKNEAPTLPFVCYKLPKRSSILPEALNPDVFVWVLETPEDCSTSMKTFVDKVRSALTLRYDGVLPQHIATALNEPEPVNVVPATKVLAAQQEKLSPSIPQSQRSSRISKATGSGLRSNLGASSQTNRCFSRQPKNPVLVHQQPGFSFQPLPKEVRDYLVRVDGDIDLATLLHRLRYERRQQQKQYIQHNAQKLVHDAYFGTNSDTRQSDLQCRTLGTSLASPEVTGLESSQYAAQLEQNSVPLDRFSMPISQRCHVNATVDTSSELCAPCSGSTAAQTSSAADGSTLSSKKRRFSALPSLSTTTSMPNSDSLREPSLSLESRQALCHVSVNPSTHDNITDSVLQRV